MKRKIWLGCGGYLYFDKTEAMCTIDINSGKSDLTSSSKNVEETLVRINLEAAEEIARQLRLRNIGGLIICDFIDMKMRKNKRRVLEKLRECMKEDSAKCSILGMSEFGLVEMTRQRSRFSLAQILLTPCPYCNGNSHIKSLESISIEIERAWKKILNTYTYKKIQLMIHPTLQEYIKKETLSILMKHAKKKHTQLILKTNDTFHLNQYQFTSMPHEKILEF